MGARPPILRGKDHGSPSVFRPAALLREARRQRGLPDAPVPPVCVLDPDGDLVRRLRREGRARPHPGWACYHTGLDLFALGAREVGAVAFAVGAPFAVLVAEELFASGCRLLLSLTSAGQVAPEVPTPSFVLIERALRDEGTSYHYLPPSDFAEGDPALIARAAAALAGCGRPVVAGASWTTDAPFRETEGAIAAARAGGALAVEMEAAALYAFARAAGAAVVCLAHVTNSMGRDGDDFEKGEAEGTEDALAVLGALATLADGEAAAAPLSPGPGLPAPPAPR